VAGLPFTLADRLAQVKEAKKETGRIFPADFGMGAGASESSSPTIALRVDRRAEELKSCLAEHLHQGWMGMHGFRKSEVLRP